MAGGTPGRRGGAVLHGEAVGQRPTKEYQAWMKMRQRCRRHPHYVKYGVTVCERWQHSFSAFLLDVGRAPSPQHSLDRWPNPNGNYEPGNVRWATSVEQRHNRRSDAGVGRPPWTGGHRPSLSGANCPAAKLTSANVATIRAAKASGARTVDLAIKFGVTRSTIKNIVAGRTWVGGISHGSA